MGYTIEECLAVLHSLRKDDTLADKFETELQTTQAKVAHKIDELYLDLLKEST